MTTKPIINVLITAMGCNTAISIAKGLRLNADKRYRIIGTDMLPSYEAAGSIFCDKFFQVPSFKDESFISKLIDISIEEGVKVIMSVVDMEAAKLAKYTALFEERGIELCLPDSQVIDICNDKYKTNRYLAERDVKIAKTYLEKEINDAGSLNYPLFIKPRFGVSSADCHKIINQEELSFFMGKVDEPIIQEFISGDQYVIDVLNDLSGKNIVAIPRHEISSKAGIGVKAVTVHDDALSEYGKKISELLGIKGVANIEVFKKDEEISLIEVNPRFSAGSILSVVAGVNLPAIIVDLFLGLDISSYNKLWIDGVYMSRYWEEAFSHNGEMISPDNFYDNNLQQTFKK